MQLAHQAESCSGVCMQGGPDPRAGTATLHKSSNNFCLLFQPLQFFHQAESCSGVCMQGGPDPRAGSAALHGAALAGACKPAQPDVPFCQVCHCGVWAGASQPQGEQVHQHLDGLAAQKQGQDAEGRSQWVSAHLPLRPCMGSQTRDWPQETKSCVCSKV